ncbi:MAG: hypothetical protein HY691_07100 [Chloroflexi bacterium]|nr:hypothetical protein [Chloroflexota bacterium]
MQDVLVAVRDDPLLETWLAPRAALPGFDRLVVPIFGAPAVRVYRLEDPEVWLRAAQSAPSSRQPARRFTGSSR